MSICMTFVFLTYFTLYVSKIFFDPPPRVTKIKTKINLGLIGLKKRLLHVKKCANHKHTALINAFLF